MSKSDGTTRNASGGIESYTNDYGMMILGNPTLLAEDAQRQEAAQEVATEEKAAAATYEKGLAAGRQEAAAAARALWENTTPAPAVERDGPQVERERNR